MSEGEKSVEIRQLAGRANELYRLVAPVVMDPAVIKQNLGYPFRTSDRYCWYVALGEGECVLGFIPVEVRRASAIINNYYIAGHDPAVLSALLQAVVETVDSRLELLSLTVMGDDVEVFSQQGFVPYLVLKKYVKMRWAGNAEDPAGAVTSQASTIATADEAPATATTSQASATAEADDSATPAVKRRGRPRKKKSDN